MYVRTNEKRSHNWNTTEFAGHTIQFYRRVIVRVRVVNTEEKLMLRPECVYVCM